MTDPRDVRIAQLTDALKSASDVMNHFGDVLNGMDCVAEVEEDTGVPNSWVDGVFEQVRTALTPKPDAPPVPYGQGSGPLPGKNVTVVQTGDKTLFITAPDDPPDHKGEAVAWAYQFAGARGACVEALDNLSAVAQGLPPRHEWPVTAPASRSADSDRIEDLEGALRKANDRLAAIHRAHQDGVHPSVNRLVDSLPTLIEEGEKALREEAQ